MLASLLRTLRDADPSNTAQSTSREVQQLQQLQQSYQGARKSDSLEQVIFRQAGRLKLEEFRNRQLQAHAAAAAALPGYSPVTEALRSLALTTDAHHPPEAYTPCPCSRHRHSHSLHPSHLPRLHHLVHRSCSDVGLGSVTGRAACCTEPHPTRPALDPTHTSLAVADYLLGACAVLAPRSHPSAPTAYSSLHASPSHARHHDPAALHPFTAPTRHQRQRMLLQHMLRSHAAALEAAATQAAGSMRPGPNSQDNRLWAGERDGEGGEVDSLAGMGLDADKEEGVGEEGRVQLASSAESCLKRLQQGMASALGSRCATDEAQQPGSLEEAAGALAGASLAAGALQAAAAGRPAGAEAEAAQPLASGQGPGAAEAGTVADLLAGGDPLVELLLAQVDSLMRERGELQRLVAGLQYEHGQMEELIGYLAMNQAEGEEGPGSEELGGLDTTPAAPLAPWGSGPLSATWPWAPGAPPTPPSYQQPPTPPPSAGGSTSGSSGEQGGSLAGWGGSLTAPAARPLPPAAPTSPPTQTSGASYSSPPSLPARLLRTPAPSPAAGLPPCSARNQPAVWKLARSWPEDTGLRALAQGSREGAGERGWQCWGSGGRGEGQAGGAGPGGQRVCSGGQWREAGRLRECWGKALALPGSQLQLQQGGQAPSQQQQQQAGQGGGSPGQPLVRANTCLGSSWSAPGSLQPLFTKQCPQPPSSPPNSPQPLNPSCRALTAAPPPLADCVQGQPSLASCSPPPSHAPAAPPASPPRSLAPHCATAASSDAEGGPAPPPPRRWSLPASPTSSRQAVRPLQPGHPLQLAQQARQPECRQLRPTGHIILGAA
ncbi:hypothetical protein QJQ45_020309 [Haematococcus lacustris]|nr:hypothetical protein QJQ45_020309 [Haematococcus lacustris]